jgi:hypothetical protein
VPPLKTGMMTEICAGCSGARLVLLVIETSEGDSAGGSASTVGFATREVATVSVRSGRFWFGPSASRWNVARSNEGAICCASKSTEPGSCPDNGSLPAVNTCQSFAREIISRTHATERVAMPPGRWRALL